MWNRDLGMQMDVIEEKTVEQVRRATAPGQEPAEEVRSKMMQRLTWLVQGTVTAVIVALFSLASLPAAAQSLPGIVGDYEDLEALVAAFQGPTPPPSIVNAGCVSDPDPGSSPLRCAVAGGVPIPDSGWEIENVCFVVLDNGEMAVGFDQAGAAGDVDGDGNPNPPPTVSLEITELPVIGSDEGYRFTLDSVLDGYTFFVTRAEVGDLVQAGAADAEGDLCFTMAADFSSPAEATAADPGTCIAGARVGSYRAGTTGTVTGLGNTTDEVLLFIDDITSLPGGANPSSPVPGAVTVDQSAFLARWDAGGTPDGCEEDFVTLLAIADRLEFDKAVQARCIGETYRFSARYTIRNGGAREFDEVVLEDFPSTVPGGLLEDPSCQLSGDSTVTNFNVVPGANGAFTATLGPLRAGDLNLGGEAFPQVNDVDCGGDADPNTPNCGEVEITCTWDAIPATDLLPQVSLSNDATATAVVDGTDVRVEMATAGPSVAVLDDICRPPNFEMRKEHEGVGYDNLFSLLPDLPFGNGFTWGSAVNPNDGMDVSLLEKFEVIGGAVEVQGRPGVYATFPRIPRTPGTVPNKGSAATFKWTIQLQDAIRDDEFDISCSVCAQTPWTDNPAETFVPMYSSRPSFGQKLMIRDEPVRLRVKRICGKGAPLDCEDGYIDAITTPGLERIDTSEGLPVEFLGCKPKITQLDPTSLFVNPFRGDLIEITLHVPASEQAQLFVDATSCEVSYLTTAPEGP